jgi:mannose-6-phosphate isomerase-like protein (cupin superfamily)
MVAHMEIVKRETIPPIRAVEQGGQAHGLGELRDFRWNDQLRDFMPATTDFSVSWVQLENGETLEPHVHPIQSMMVVYAGSGKMLGDLERPIGEGDVIVVPPGRSHGFVGGPDGLYALSIQFGDGLYTVPDKPRVVFSDGEDSLQGLLAYNEKRLAEFVKGPIFELLSDGTLEDARKRKVFLDTLQIWVDGNQRLLFSRQAACSDPAYESIFLRHMQEEMGHDVLHKDRNDESSRSETPARDSVMEAITNWFPYQMYILDNAEKAAIIHLVIENASSRYHAHAAPVLSKYVNSHYFEVHVDADAGHAAMGVELLRNETPRTYARLKRIVGETWDMVGAMTERVVQLTRAAE